MPIQSSGEVQYPTATDNPTINATDDNQPTATPTPTPTTTPTITIKHNPTSTPTPIHSPQTYSTPVINQDPIKPQPTPPPNITTLQSSISNLGANGGTIVLDNSITVMGQDVLLPSNVELSGANPSITISLIGNNIQVAPNTQNITIKNLTIDGLGLFDRFGLVIGQNASNIKLENLIFNNYDRTKGSIISMGNNVVINKASFNSVTQVYPIQIGGSNVTVTNSGSTDNSIFSFVSVGGGLTNINVINNSVTNRPLFSANYGATPTKNISIENNTNYFPNGTYGILVRGGVGEDTPISHENVTVKGNIIGAAPGAWNAIAIYGLTRNALVMNNTVDMSRSGHNAIGISSGINVIVKLNTVFGCTESTEGGIEVESNPVHNRAVGISENVTVTQNTVYNCDWGIYVRIMCPEHPNWNGTLQRSKNILIENNTVFSCNIGINLLYGEQIIVKNNDIAANAIPFKVDSTNVFNYTGPVI